MFSHENRRAYGLVARRTFDPANLGKGKESSPARLDLHLIVDHYGTHPHPRVESWLVRHPRFHLHGIPTSSSWLNLVERCFRDITDQRWRRGTLENVRALVRSITDYLDNPNQNPKAFVWTASVEAILRKIAINKEALESPHQEPVRELLSPNSFSAKPRVHRTDPIALGSAR